MPRIPYMADIEWETVEFPLTGGVDLRSPARAVAAPRLLTLQNARFDENVGGIRKRRGHTKRRVRSSSTLLGVNQSGQYLFGYGDAASDVTPSVASPDAVHLRGAARRDDEVVTWSGHGLYSWPYNADSSDGWASPVSAVMPVAKTYPISKRPQSQTWGDMAVGNGIAVVAFYDATTTQVLVDTYDPDTWAPRLRGQSFAVANPLAVRCIPCGDWVHVLVATATTLTMKSIHRGSPHNLRTGLTSLGDCDTYFDARQIDDEHWAVVKRDTSDVLKVTHLNADGSTDSLYGGANRTLTTDVGLASRVAFGVHPTTGALGVAWVDAAGTAVKSRVYEATGAALSVVYDLTSIYPLDVPGPLTVAPAYLREASGINSETFWIYATNSGLVGQVPSVGKYYMTRTTADHDIQLGHAVVAGHAFRAGEETFVMLQHAYASTQLSRLQFTYYLCDETMAPVGMFERGTAQTTPAGANLPGIYFDPGQETKNQYRFRTLIFYRQRVDSVNNDQYDELSMKAVELNFMPKLRSAQLGRSLYFAGAQVHTYDGHAVYEAGFHGTAENVSLTIGAAGNLTGTYQYRLRPCYKTAQGEEIIGPAITTDESPALTSDKCVLTWTPWPWTRKENVYWRIYRRAATGTQYFLVSNLDPSVTTGDNDCVINNRLSTGTLTFTDNMTDDDLLSREKDRADGGVLEPFSPMACEVVAAGRDRLWLAGGEIPPGTIQPSLVYQPEAGVSTAEFNTAILTTLDRADEPITGFGFMGHSTLVFRRAAIYAFEADGPTNTLAGGFDYPRVVAADTGAVGPEGIVLTTSGLLFQAPSGIQLLSTNFQLVDAGEPVRSETVTADIVSGILSVEDQEVRFYRSDGDALVFNYRTGEWAKWSGLECQGAVKNPVTGLAVLAREAGDLWVEEDGVWGDDGSGYRYGFRSAWLHDGKLQGSHRVRRVLLMGDYLGSHTLYGRVYMDDRDYADDAWTWNPATDINVAAWGDGAWGDGVWGNVNTTGTIEDNTYQLRKRLRRQKCQRVSVEFHDGGALTEGPAFTAFALELGRRGGAARIPARTNTAE